MAAVTTPFLYANRDDEFRSACDAIPLADCETHSLPSTCDGCPAWEGLKARVSARMTAGAEPGVITRRSM
jgi:hypothetical protein